MENKELLQVRVFFSAVLEKDIFKSKAVAVSSENGVGKFDVLPYHTNFITLIFGNVVIYNENKEEKSYQFERGVLEVRENKVDIFLGL